ncbi:PspC domain-containing protein [Tsukamurella strandjordii]|uniref:PspC domain-containing protein n=1 Tax=Tsukamurella TaxID=2060 RepID=UPI001C7CFE01|nr:PspC domain-containing protein [Tsukamurella sp. TY48]GIZ96329.1 hypothetical protein TTY48_09410 [Tsukamurella sp. TY48]
MDTATLSSQIRQMWDTRPLRARRAPIAGVCTGFARRYQVDVALVRAAFLGAALLGGAGLLAYIVAIFVMPKEPYREYRPERSGPPPFVLIIAAGIAVTMGSGMSSSWPGSGLISAALLLVGWYALHQRTPVAPPGTAISSQFVDAGPAPVGAWQPPAAPFRWQPAWQPPAGTDPSTFAAPAEPHPGARPEAEAHATGTTQDRKPGADAPSAPAVQAHPQAQASQQPQRRDQVTEEIRPPRWDPLGAAPFAWDLPEPAQAQAPAPIPRRRSRITPVTLGIALLTAAAIAAVNVTGLASISPVLAGSLVLGVIAGGLLFGAFQKAGYGLLVAAIPLAGFVVIAATAQNVMSGYVDAPRGDRSYVLTDPTTMPEEFKLQAGTLTLDLRGMTLDEDRKLKTRVAAGETRITVPESMNVEVTCSVNVGDTRCPQGTLVGVGAKPDAPTLKIDASGNVGSVEVNRVR